MSTGNFTCDLNRAILPNLYLRLYSSNLFFNSAKENLMYNNGSRKSDRSDIDVMAVPCFYLPPRGMILVSRMGNTTSVSEGPTASRYLITLLRLKNSDVHPWNLRQ